MHSRKNFALFPLLFSFTVVVMSVFSQQAQAQNSWLDRPLVNWNKRSIGSPQLPQPSAEVQRENIQRCRADVRQPSNTAERAFMRRGWTLYGPVYSYDLTSIVTALSGFCRLGSQRGLARRARALRVRRALNAPVSDAAVDAEMAQKEELDVVRVLDCTAPAWR